MHRISVDYKKDLKKENELCYICIQKTYHKSLLLIKIFEFDYYSYQQQIDSRIDQSLGWLDCTIDQMMHHLFPNIPLNIDNRLVLTQSHDDYYNL